MKRYFIAPVAELSSLATEFHYIDLGSHGEAGSGYALVAVVDEHGAVPKEWDELPHVLDASSLIDPHAARLLDIGVKRGHTMAQTAMIAGKIHRMLKP